MKKLSLIIFILSLIIIKPIKAEIYNYNLLLNGDFLYNYNCEDSASCSIMGWEQNNCDYINFLGPGDFSLGNSEGVKEWVRQKIQIPNKNGIIELSYDFWFSSYDYLNKDYFEFAVIDAQNGEYYIHDFYNYSNGDTNYWINKKYNLTSYKGKEIYIFFAGESNINSAGTTYIDLDNINVKIKSPSEFYGYVVNKKQAVKNANIVVKNPKGKRIWTGKTNNDGIFFIPEINSYKNKKIQIIVIKDGIKKVFKRKTKWAYRYFETFKFN